MSKEAILETYTKAATVQEKSLCCAVNYREEFAAEELAHIPDAVLDRNYGCGIPPELGLLGEGRTVLDLGPGVGRDCFIASRKVGPEGRVFGLDMNQQMLAQARSYQRAVEDALGYGNIEFLHGQFDVEIPLPDNTADVVFSNCVNNLAVDKDRAYREIFRVLRPGSKLSFSDIVSYEVLPEELRHNDQAWADCVAGVLSFQKLTSRLKETGFHGTCLRVDYLWKKGEDVLSDYFSREQIDSMASETVAALKGVRLYSVAIEAHKPALDPSGPCLFIGQYAMYHGPAQALHLDEDPDHVFPAGELKEVCEKTATILKSDAFGRHFTVFEPQGDVEARACIPGGTCC